MKTRTTKYGSHFIELSDTEQLLREHYYACDHWPENDVELVGDRSIYHDGAAKGWTEVRIPEIKAYYLKLYKARIHFYQEWARLEEPPHRRIIV